MIQSRVVSPIPDPCIETHDHEEDNSCVLHSKPQTSSKRWKSGVLSTIDNALHSLFMIDHSSSVHDVEEPKFKSNLVPHESRVSWHPHKQFVAASRNTSIGIYDIGKSVWLEPLLSNSAMKDGIFCMKWSAETDCVLVGTSDGISCWRIYSLHEGNTEQSWMQYLHHPRRRPVHVIDVSSHGRIFASMTCGENMIYIWDGNLATYAPLYCVDGMGCSLKWSPGGSGIVVSDQFGGVDIVDAHSWQHETCINSPQKKVDLLCWIGEKHCIMASKGSNQLSYFEILADDHWDCESTVRVNSPPIPINTNAFDRGLNLVIEDLASEDKGGRFLAISFRVMADPSTVNVNILSDVIFPELAVYSINLKPVLTLTFLRVLDSSDRSVPESLVPDSYPLAFTFGSTPRVVSKDSTSKAQLARNSSDEEWVIVEETEQLENVRIVSQSFNAVAVTTSWSNGALTIDYLESSSAGLRQEAIM